MRCVYGASRGRRLITTPTRPDVLLIASEWPGRALLNAELIEAGHKVVGLDGGPIPAVYRSPSMQPRSIIVDLQGAADPRALLQEISSVVPPHRVLVITALATISADELQQFGYHVITRPLRIGEVVGAVGKLLSVRS